MSRALLPLGFALFALALALLGVAGSAALHTRLIWPGLLVSLFTSVYTASRWAYAIGRQDGRRSR